VSTMFPPNRWPRRRGLPRFPRALCGVIIGSVGPTVLIVDDNASFRRSARALLDAEGFVVIGEAATGSAAVTAVDRLDPDVVLLDVVLPDIDGFEVCARITRSGRSRPAVVLTSGRDSADFLGRLDGCAARGFLSKAGLTGPALAAIVCPR